MEWRAETSRGLVRPDNEDSFSVEHLVSPDHTSLWVAMVADGLGGHECGEVASKLAVEYAMACLSERVLNSRESPMVSHDIADMLKEAVTYANEKVLAAASQGQGQKGMGTTLTACVISEDSGRLFVGHVGDSRVYLISRGTISQITEDQSVTGELVRKGAITEEDAMRHPARNVLTNALGTGQHLDVASYSVSLSPGDVVLLSTDGLTSLVSAKEILDLLDQKKMTAIEKDLINLANNRGGYDNATVIVMWPEVFGKRGEPSWTQRTCLEKP